MLAALSWLGFLLGVRHAFEADHLAAVTSLASRSRRRAHTMRVAAAWGLGHAAALTATGTVMVALGAAWPASLGRTLEALAGAVLVWLGVDVLRRAARASVRDGAPAPIAPAAPLSRALLVGGVHGLEGSGAVVLVALPALRSSAHALAYLGLFGAGSILGMLLCSLAVSLPMDAAARRFAGAGRWLQLAVGATSVLLGSAIAGRALYSYIRSIFT